MSQSIVVADSENERSEDNDSDVEFLKECGPEKVKLKKKIYVILC